MKAKSVLLLVFLLAFFVSGCFEEKSIEKKKEHDFIKQIFLDAAVGDMIVATDKKSTVALIYIVDSKNFDTTINGYSPIMGIVDFQQLTINMVLGVIDSDGGGGFAYLVKKENVKKAFGAMIGMGTNFRKN